MKRLLLKLSLFVLAGAIVNVAVAWTCNVMPRDSAIWQSPNVELEVEVTSESRPSHTSWATSDPLRQSLLNAGSFQRYRDMPDHERERLVSLGLSKAKTRGSAIKIRMPTASKAPLLRFQIAQKISQSAIYAT